jgi:hypothetical protein
MYFAMSGNHVMKVSLLVAALIEFPARSAHSALQIALCMNHSPHTSAFEQALLMVPLRGSLYETFTGCSFRQLRECFLLDVQPKLQE